MHVRQLCVWLCVCWRCGFAAAQLPARDSLQDMVATENGERGGGEREEEGKLGWRGREGGGGGSGGDEDVNEDGKRGGGGKETKERGGGGEWRRGPESGAGTSRGARAPSCTAPGRSSAWETPGDMWACGRGRTREDIWACGRRPLHSGRLPPLSPPPAG